MPKVDASRYKKTRCFFPPSILSLLFGYQHLRFPISPHIAILTVLITYFLRFLYANIVRTFIGVPSPPSQTIVEYHVLALSFGGSCGVVRVIMFIVFVPSFEVGAVVCTFVEEPQGGFRSGEGDGTQARNSDLG